MLTGPERYDLTLTPTAYTLDRKFCGFACKKKLPKLYVVAVEGQVVYVGVTRQPMSNRLRYGFKPRVRGDIMAMLGETSTRGSAYTCGRHRKTPILLCWKRSRPK